MKSNLTFKSIIILAVLVFGIVKLLPSLEYYTMDKEVKKEKESTNDPDYQVLKTEILNLGLDLQGGMHVVVEIDHKEFLLRRAVRKDDILEKAAELAANDDLAPIKKLRNTLEENGKTLKHYFGSSRDKKRDTDEKIESLLKEELDKAIVQALEIIRNRVDEFGVAEPTIQQLGNKRIIIELAGVVNPDRIRRNIKRTAQLDFSMVAEQKDASRVLTAANEFYRKKFELDKKDEKKEEKSEDETTTEQLFGATSEVDSTKEESSYDEYLFLPYRQDHAQEFAISAKNRELTESLLEDKEFQKYIRTQAGAFRILFMKPRGLKANEKPTSYTLIVVRERIEMTGEGITSASAQPNPQGVNDYLVSMKFDDRSGRKFSYLSERYLNKRLSIILDNVVQSAPTFVGKIPAHSGAQITGMAQQEASDLAIVLRSGALPAPLKIIEENTVGASLGADSVAAGTKSILIGFVIVLIFMIIYYKKAGIIASFAVIINVLLMFAALAAFGGTLTLPGIAGLILTIGMSVDANVLIYERIREEVHAGVRVFQALENGYSRAFVAIADANVTTFIAGVVLYAFGSGPVRGFALILIIGILTSMFTAIVMTKVVFAFTTKETEKTLSI
jgi:protein-export membrane protein SecD